MNNPENKKRCLLITQKRFHSLDKFLKDALIAKGFEVVVANDEYPESLLGRIMGKMQFPLIFSNTYDYFVEHYLTGEKYDLAIIIKGRGVSEKLVKKMRESIPRIIGYNWDTFDYNPSALKWYKCVDKFYTFDYVDADKYSLPCLELYSALPANTETKTIKYELSAIGRNYPDRLRYMHKVLTILKPSNVYIYLYENNIFELIINFFRNPALYIKYRKHISLKSLTHSEYQNIIRSSEFTIDYANQGQTGITMRCFESIKLKTRIITNNKYLKRSSYFNNTNSVIFNYSDSAEELMVACADCSSQPFKSKTRDINNFVDDLIS
jgi:hypothetical protein